MSSKAQTYRDYRVASKQRSSEAPVRGTAAIREDILLATKTEGEKFEPKSLNPVDVLKLQHTLGNRAVQRLIVHELMHGVQKPRSNGIRVAARNKKRALAPISLTSPLHVQREEIEMEGVDVRPKGLLVEKHIKDVTGKWANIWRSEKDSTIKVLLDEMLKIVNTKFSGLRVAPVVFDPTPSSTEGGFRHQEWKISMNLDIVLGRTVSFDDKVSSLSANDLALIGETLYHEARHAEQSFLVARKRAITIRDPHTLAQNLEIPVPVAKAAIDVGPPARDNPDMERIEEWEAFAPGGKYYQYWKWNESMKKVTKDILEPIVNRSPKTPDEYRSEAENINKTINVLGTHWVFPFDKLVEMEKLSGLKSIDKNVLEQLRKITSAFEKLVRTIDAFRLTADKLQAVKSDSADGKGLIADADLEWINIRIAQLELFIAQGRAYEAYPHEIDARRAGIAAQESISAGTKPVRRP